MRFLAVFEVGRRAACVRVWLDSYATHAHLNQMWSWSRTDRTCKLILDYNLVALIYLSSSFVLTASSEVIESFNNLLISSDSDNFLCEFSSFESARSFIRTFPVEPLSFDSASKMWNSSKQHSSRRHMNDLFQRGDLQMFPIPRDLRRVKKLIFDEIGLKLLRPHDFSRKPNDFTTIFDFYW